MEKGKHNATIDQAWHFIKHGQIDEALNVLSGPMQEFRNGDHDRGSADLLSMYGFCVGVGHKKRKEGIRLCKSAIGLDKFNPRHHYLLGRVYLAASSRKKALESFRRGLSIDSSYRPIHSVMEKMGIRQKPVFPFLARSNPINVTLGRLRFALKGGYKDKKDDDENEI